MLVWSALDFRLHLFTCLLIVSPSRCRTASHFCASGAVGEIVIDHPLYERNELVANLEPPPAQVRTYMCLLCVITRFLMCLFHHRARVCPLRSLGQRHSCWGRHRPRRLVLYGRLRHGSAGARSHILQLDEGDPACLLRKQPDGGRKGPKGRHGRRKGGERGRDRLPLPTNTQQEAIIQIDHADTKRGG